MEQERSRREDLTVHIELNSSHQIPQVGFGTWQSAPNEVGIATEAAVRAGYRHLDLAKIYQNQEEVARGIKAAGVPREELFLTSKLWNNSHRPDLVEAALDDTLKELETTYLDLYLIHWPVSFSPDGDLTQNLFPAAPAKNGVAQVALDVGPDGPSLVDTWKAMLKLVATGKVKSVGVSNFSLAAIDALIAATGVTPSVHQIERHPLLIQPELVAHHRKHGIHITAYSPLGNNNVGAKKLFEYPEIMAIAKEIGATPAQVLIAWGSVGGHSVIPKSITPSRIASNFVQISLSDQHIAKINELGAGERKHRFNIPFDYRPQWDINVFDEKAEETAGNQVRIQ